MASKTGKLVLTGAVTGMLLAGCQTQPLSTPSMALGAQGQSGGYGLLDTACMTQAYAVFAKSRQDFHFTGARNLIQGDVHTNGQLKMAGNNDKITGKSEALGGYFVKGNNNTAGDRQTGVTEEGWPLTVAAPAMTYHYRGDIELKGKLKPGVYVATGKITVSGNGTSGTGVSFVAASIQFAGNNMSLTPAEGGVLAYATGGANAIHIAGNGGRYEGLCVAKAGEFQLTGHNNELRGMVMVDTFKIAGSNNAIKFQDLGYCAPAPASPEATPTASPSASPSAVPSAEPTKVTPPTDKPPSDKPPSDKPPSSDPGDGTTPSDDPAGEASTPPEEVSPSPVPTTTVTPGAEG